jgi:sigma-B regulation protein RsbU (phosphoserine phosphatase)
MMAEKERVNTELNLATRIQKDNLPNTFPAFPDRHEFDIYASMNPAREVGGDFYDYFFVDDDHLAMVMADVSDKGVPAAMLMMKAKTMIQTQASKGLSPKQVFETTNQLLCENNNEKMFVTAWLGILNLKTGLLTAANAGHEFPVLKMPQGSFEIIKDKHCFVLGGMKRMKYVEYEMQIPPGAKLFVYTDGVPEAMNPDREQFGMERTLQALNKVKDETPEIILKSVYEDVESFVAGQEVHDDITMLCIEYVGEEV